MLRFIRIMVNKRRILFVVPKLGTGGVSSSLLGLLRLIAYEKFFQETPTCFTCFPLK